MQMQSMWSEWAWIHVLSTQGHCLLTAAIKDLLFTYFIRPVPKGKQLDPRKANCCI
jgi:hypothetical protein